MQDFGRRNPLIARQLADAIAKLREIHHHTLRLAEYKTIWLKKVRYIMFYVLVDKINIQLIRQNLTENEPTSYMLIYYFCIRVFQTLYVFFLIRRMHI